MLFRHGHEMITVPLSPALARLIRKYYREERSRWKNDRLAARRSVVSTAFYYVTADHPDFEHRPLADVPDYLRRAS